MKNNGVVCRYICAGEEVAPSTGTPHLQGMVYFEHAKTMSQVKKAFKENGVKQADTMHLEVMRDIEASVEYCKKEGKWFEHGELPDAPTEKGKKERIRWAENVAMAKEGRFDDMDPQIQMCYMRNAEYLHRRIVLARELQDTEEQMLWYWGATRTGKSRAAKAESPGAYMKLCNRWWDGYVDQEFVIIDDFDRKHEMLCHHLKHWLDRYPFNGETKGGMIYIRPRRIIVTSNWHPRDIWTDEEDLKPILARVKCVEFKSLRGSAEMSPLPMLGTLGRSSHFRPTTPVPPTPPESEAEDEEVPPTPEKEIKAAKAVKFRNPEVEVIDLTQESEEEEKEVIDLTQEF